MNTTVRGNLLIVEDERALADIVSVRLVNAGYAVRVAHTVGAGLAALRAAPPDLLILDILLPDGSGYEILGQMRDDSDLEDIPVIMLTGLGDHEQIENGFIKGANAYLPKPYEPDKLIAAIELLFAESSADGAAESAGKG